MHKFDKVLFCITWAYLASTVLALGLMYLTGDRWWPGSLLLFGPRWVMALPIIPLLPLILWRRPGLLIPLALGAAIALGPFMGLKWSFSKHSAPNGQILRVLTCNVKTGHIDLQALSQFIMNTNADVVALQECPKSLQLDLPPHYQRFQAGINAILSKYAIIPHEPTLTRHPQHKWPRHSLISCTLKTDWGDIIFASVYLPSPRFGLMHILDRAIGINPNKSVLLSSEIKDRDVASAIVRNSLSSKMHPIIVAGDFNMPVESVIYNRDWSDMQNAFSRTGRGYGRTFHDRAGPIPISARIDHILCSETLTPISCRVGPDVGSDHRPVIAEIMINSK